MCRAQRRRLAAGTLQCEPGCADPFALPCTGHRDAQGKAPRRRWGRGASVCLTCILSCMLAGLCTATEPHPICPSSCSRAHRVHQTPPPRSTALARSRDRSPAPLPLLQRCSKAPELLEVVSRDVCACLLGSQRRRQLTGRRSWLWSIASRERARANNMGSSTLVAPEGQADESASVGGSAANSRQR